MAEVFTDDPFIEAEIERAIAPYRALLAPDALDEFRDALRDALTAHPVAVDLVGRLRPRAAVAESGDVVAGGSTSAASSARPAKSGGSAR
jgi:hypothetical protein